MSTNANTINFARPFGAKPEAAAQSKGNNSDRPKSRFWLNIGYDSGVKDEATGGTKFVSLPTGIPLDGQDRVKTNSRNDEFAAFQQARNALLDQILAAAEKLAPGEERLLNLQIQLRRVNDEVEEVTLDKNQFVANLPNLLG